MNPMFLAIGLESSTWNALFGAGLGAAFYILIKTHKYLVQRTFDPRYNNAYLTRFVTGVLAGFILSLVIDYILVTDEPGGAASFIIVMPGVVAILGGFSAEAVEQILQRMVEILLTAVRGDGAAKAKQDEQIKMREWLTEVSEAKDDPAKLDAVLKDIQNRLKGAAS
jgi:hypothetical protein